MIFCKTSKNVEPSAGNLVLSSGSGWLLGPTSPEAALKISTFSACVELIANSVAMLPQFVMCEDDKKHIEGHWLGSVLWERPNEMMTPEVFTQKTMLDTLLHGDGYVWNYRDGAGRVIERIPIPAGNCEPWFDLGRGKWWYMAIDPKSGQIYTLDPADLSHYLNFSLDGIHGMSILERAKTTLETATNMDAYAGDIYRNGGRPSGVLTVDTDLGSGRVAVKNSEGETETISKKEYIRREWDGNYSGPGKAFRTAILDLGLKYQPIAMNNSDAQFIEQKNLSAEDICRFCCVPPYKAGLGKQSYNSNEQNNIEFAVQTLQPKITAREQEDSWKLLPLSEQRKKHYRIRYNMAALLRGDAKTRAEVEQIYRTIGAYSVNDVLALEDRPSVPGGDTRYASLNYIPLEFFERLSVARNEGGKEGQ